MKTRLLILIFCAVTFLAKSQNESVEKSTYGVQTGLLGIWGYNEAKLSNAIALRTEIGFDAGIASGNSFNGSAFGLIPVLVLEPRVYYNLKKRINKQKSIDDNSGNFISLKTSYHPDLFVISNEKGIDVESDISIIPSWGLRRNLGKHFNYEAGIGIGYRHVFKNKTRIPTDFDNVDVNLNLRIGYRF